MVAWVVAFVLVVGGGGATVFLANYEPIVVDTTSFGVTPADRVVRATSPSGDDVTEFRLDANRGDAFTFEFYLHNAGPWPVTITRVGPTGPDVAYRVEEATLGPISGETPPGRVALPYTIPARSYARLEMRATVGWCVAPNSALTIGEVPVTYRSPGPFEHDVSITIPYAITFSNPTGERCSG